MNEHDSEVLAGILETLGYAPAARTEAADVILINTCCIRESAEQKIYGKIGSLKPLKAAHPGLIIGVAGCMTQQEGAPAKLRQKAPHIDLLFGTHNLHNLPVLLWQAMDRPGKTAEIWPEAGAIVEHLPHVRTDGLKAWVAIMYGCNNFCSYCIVPYVRGRERSRQPAEIAAEVRELAGQGIREITLLGQNVNSYGRGLPEPVDFADLLEILEPISGIERIRYMTSHPRDFSDKLIDTIARSAKVCEHYHLPVQAGSDRILQLMNRGYTREVYLTLVDKIRQRTPDASLTTDIIVGFPGETEEDFADTLDLVQRARFDTAYTFLYSRRSGTKAADLAEQVPLAVKKERLQRLMDTQNRISREINEAQVGQTVEVLVEGPSSTDPDVLSGRTRTNKIVLAPAPAGEITRLTGKLIKVKLT